MATIDHRPPRDRSDLSNAKVARIQSAEFIVYADCPMTRRKRHHIICDGVDTIVFRSRWWSDIQDWLADEEISSYTLVTDRDRYTVQAVRAEAAKDK